MQVPEEYQCLVKHLLSLKADVEFSIFVRYGLWGVFREWLVRGGSEDESRLIFLYCNI
jgi:hypothetical protein